PWLKDHDLVEGRTLYDLMPTNYNSGYKWVRNYLYGDTNILSLSSAEDTPAALFPKFIHNSLLSNTNTASISLDDIGVRVLNRRNYYSRWPDFPTPTWVGETITAVESLGSTSITNVSP